MTTFNLPDLGEGLAEAEIVRWHVNVGDTVTADQPMVAVETAKAVVEVPAPFSGVIKRLHGQPGDIIPTGAPLIEFDTGTTAAAAGRRAGHQQSSTSSGASDAGTVVGSMPTSDVELVESAQPGGDPRAGNGSHHARADAGDGAVSARRAGADGAPNWPPPLRDETNTAAERLRAAPAARALAKKLGMDLAQISGSGRGGVIVVDDVIAHAQVATDGPVGFRGPGNAAGIGSSDRAAPPAERDGLGARRSDGSIHGNDPRVPADRDGLSARGSDGGNHHGTDPRAAARRADLATRHADGNGPGVTATPFSGGERLRGMRRAMAQSMTLARDNVASCTIFDDADLHRWTASQDITTRLLRAIAAAAQAEPALNAWFDGNTQIRRLATHINIGIAVDTPQGLIVPVIRDVGNRTPGELRQELDRLKRAARERTAVPEDLRDATFMLSNFGMIAGRYATPVVVPPTVAILGSGRLTRDIVALENGMEAHLRMPLSLTFDHRCVTGGEAARFLAAILRDLEKDT